MATDPRIKSFRLEFPLREPSTGLRPMRTYHGRVRVEVTEPISIKQLRIQFEGWERIDFGSKIGATRKQIFRTSQDLLQDEVADTIAHDATFDFACTMPNVNFPSAMKSTICEIEYAVDASLVGASLARVGSSSCANHVVPLAAERRQVQLAPHVLPSGVGWLKPLVMRDGVMLAEPVRRRFRRHTVQTAMNICVQVRNHCCTLGEPIAVDVDATMLQKDRVLTFVRAAVIEQVALKTQVDDAAVSAFVSNQDRAQAATVVLAERTLNRKVSEIDPSALSGMAARDWGTSDRPLLGLDGVQNLRIRVPRHDVCTAEGFFFKFTHVLRLTFGLTSRPSNGRFDTKYATKDVPLRLVTSKFGDVGRMSQVEINKRLSTLTTESDSSVVSEAYSYLLSENTRATRPTPLEALADGRDVPAPTIESVVNPTSRPYTPLTRPLSSDTYASTAASIISPTSTRPFAKPYRPSSLITPLPPTPQTSQLVPQLLAESVAFESKPLPPLPKDDTSLSEEQSDSTQGRTTPPQKKSAQEGRHSGDTQDSDDEQGLFMANQQRPDSQCSRAPNRDTLVNAPSDSVYAGAPSGSDDSADASSIGDASSVASSLPSSSASLNSLSSAEDCALDSGSQRTAPSTADDTRQQQQQDKKTAGSNLLVPPLLPIVLPQILSPPKLSMNYDKRGSSQSESDTIVYSPTPDKMGDTASIRSSSSDIVKKQRPELPSLPVIASLGDMTKDLFGSPTLGDKSTSLFWGDGGF